MAATTTGRSRVDEILTEIGRQNYVAKTVVYSDTYSLVEVEVRNITDGAYVVFVYTDKRSKQKTEHTTLAGALANV